jgi:hypothetical protein
MLVRDSRTSSAKGAFGRHERRTKLEAPELLDVKPPQ